MIYLNFLICILQRDFSSSILAFEITFINNFYIQPLIILFVLSYQTIFLNR